MRHGHECLLTFLPLENDLHADKRKGNVATTLETTPWLRGGKSNRQTASDSAESAGKKKTLKTVLLLPLKYMYILAVKVRP